MAGYGVSGSDREELDRLIGVALLDDGVRNVLLNGGDRTILLEGYTLSQPTADRLKEIQAASLEQFCVEILSFLEVATGD